MEDSGKQETLADLRRLIDILLSNLEEGSKNKLMDPKELRMLSGAAIRAIRLYLTTADEDRNEYGSLYKRIRKEERSMVEDQTVSEKNKGA